MRKVLVDDTDKARWLNFPISHPGWQAKHTDIVRPKEWSEGEEEEGEEETKNNATTTDSKGQGSVHMYIHPRANL